MFKTCWCYAPRILIKLSRIEALRRSWNNALGACESDRKRNQIVWKIKSFLAPVIIQVISES